MADELTGAERVQGFAERLEREDHEAERVLSHLSVSDLSDRVLSDSGLPPAGTIRYLIQRSHAVVEAEPLAVLTVVVLAVLARTVADHRWRGEGPETVKRALTAPKPRKTVVLLDCMIGFPPFFPTSWSDSSESVRPLQ